MPFLSTSLFEPNQHESFNTKTDTDMCHVCFMCKKHKTFSLEFAIYLFIYWISWLLCLWRSKCAADREAAGWCGIDVSLLCELQCSMDTKVCECNNLRMKRRRILKFTPQVHLQKLLGKFEYLWILVTPTSTFLKIT